MFIRRQMSFKASRCSALSRHQFLKVAKSRAARYKSVAKLLCTWQLLALSRHAHNMFTLGPFQAIPPRHLEQAMHGTEQLGHPSNLVALHTSVVLHGALFRKFPLILGAMFTSSRTAPYCSLSLSSLLAWRPLSNRSCLRIMAGVCSRAAMLQLRSDHPASRASPAVVAQPPCETAQSIPSLPPNATGIYRNMHRHDGQGIGRTGAYQFGQQHTQDLLLIEQCKMPNANEKRLSAKR